MLIFMHSYHWPQAFSPQTDFVAWNLIALTFVTGYDEFNV